MGYTTNFDGQFEITPMLSCEHFKLMNEFAEERHEGHEFPGYYCQWVPNRSGTAIEWDGGEKFYEYEKWIVYLIKHFLARWGYLLNGQVMWQGEEVGDVGFITVQNNSVHIKPLRGKSRVIYDATCTVEIVKELPSRRVFYLPAASDNKI